MKTNLKESATLRVLFLATLLLKVDCVLSEDPNLDYDYGDYDISYDSLQYPNNPNNPVISASKDVNSIVRLPLCCPEGEVYDGHECILSPSNYNWRPKLDGAMDSRFKYTGFPKCEINTNHIETYQKEVHFSDKDGHVFLPYYIQTMAVPRNKYCVAKLFDGAETCESFQTKIFSCLTEQKDPQGLMWTCVTLSHILLVLTLLTYFCMSDLRCLQGQYIICFLISLLIYNLCLLPGSKLPLDISDVSCIALGAVKYFFFCGIFLWFNTICFDIWRTLGSRQDISGRKRFLLYSAYSWVIGAILTTVVLVLPYMREGSSSDSRDDPLKDKNYSMCKLKLQMNMILQIAQLLSLVIDLVFLILATCAVCNYSKFGNGLPRFDASLCLKQGWKLFLIMIAHMVSCIDADIIKFPVPLWLYVLFESVAIFGVFCYRRTVLKKLMKKICHSECLPFNEDGSQNEKGQLTMT